MSTEAVSLGPAVVDSVKPTEQIALDGDWKPQARCL